MALATGDMESVAFVWNASVSGDDANGGGATKIAWDANNPSDFFDPVTGGYAAYASAASVSDASGEIQLTNTNLGVNAYDSSSLVDGIIAYVAWSDGDGTTYDNGFYIVRRVDDNNIILSGSVYSSDTMYANITIGGCMKTLVGAVNNDLTDASGFNKYVYAKGDEADTGWDMSNSFGGTSDSFKLIAGVDASWVPFGFYTSGDDVDNYPLLTLSSEIRIACGFTYFMNFRIVSTSGSGARFGFTSGGYPSAVINCKITASTTTGTRGVYIPYGIVYHCIIDCSIVTSIEAVYISGSGRIKNCHITAGYDGIRKSVSYSGNGIEDCIIIGTGGSKRYGIWMDSLETAPEGGMYKNNVIDGFTHGIYMEDALDTTPGASHPEILIDNIIVNCSSYGIYNNGANSDFPHIVRGNKFYNCGTNHNLVLPAWMDFENDSLAGSPFVGSGNYGLISTGGGAECRDSDTDKNWLDGTQVGHRDKGPLQHQDSGGGNIIVIED